MMTTPNNKPDPSTEDRRHLPKFLLILLLSTVIGGFVGYHSVGLAKSGGVQAVADALKNVLQMALPIVAPLACLALAGIGLFLYRRAKKQFCAWDGSDETASIVEKCSEDLELSLILTNMMLFVILLMLSVALMLPNALITLICAGSALIFLAVMTLLQQKIIAMTKRLNPEKQGSIFDFKFHSKWLESCDEAEQKQIGEAALAAMKTTAFTCMALWLVLLVTSILFEFGPLPSLVALVIWAAQTIGYNCACIRLGRRKK